MKLLNPLAAGAEDGVEAQQEDVAHPLQTLADVGRGLHLLIILLFNGTHVGPPGSRGKG